jgi:hypothetical protein
MAAITFCDPIFRGWLDWRSADAALSRAHCDREGKMRNDGATGQTHHRGSTGAGQFGGLNRAIAAHDAIRRDGEAGEAGMSWKVEVVVDDSGEWEGDPLRFETEREALAYARDLELRWSAVRDKRLVKSEDPVNYSWPQRRRTRSAGG